MSLIAYFDCPTGISGDMCLGALVDAGVPLAYLTGQLERLGLGDEYRLGATAVQKQGQAATKVDVELSPEPAPEAGHHHHHHRPHRHLPEIAAIIQQAGLPERVTAWSLAIFEQLAIAEGAVHGIAPTEVHFHEVGATDAIVDIVGTCLGLDYLGIEQCYWSALPTGSGTVRAAHGQLPVPVPAVLKLWQSRAVPIYDNGLTGELVTPTGAAIAVTLAQGFGPRPAMTLKTVGLGAGTKEFATANILRIWIGETAAASLTTDPFLGTPETIVVLETQLDDLQPQAIAYLLDALLAAGAIDVFTQGITMKKSRLGTLLTVLCHPDHQAQCQRLIFQETTTLGIRVRHQPRYVLTRDWQTVQLPAGPVRIKLAYEGDVGQSPLINAHPEFEVCAAIARATNQPWQRIHQQAIAAFWAHQAPPSP
ncbi:MAG: nickel pincer cofactor biosynthesis protein LarC [Synechocystis sp.]